MIATAAFKAPHPPNKGSSGQQISLYSSGLSIIRSNRGRMVHNSLHNSDLQTIRSNKGITLLTINSDNSHCPRVFTGTDMVDFKALDMAHNGKAIKEVRNNDRQCHHKVGVMINGRVIQIYMIKRQESLIDTKKITFLMFLSRMMSMTCPSFRLHQDLTFCILNVP